MKKIFIALRLFFILTLLTGIVYPLFVTGASQLFFKSKSEGSLVFQNGKVLGSTWIGQNFKDEKYFWSRPSAVDYNPLPSGGSNLAPTSAILLEKMEERKKNLKEGLEKIPEDLLFSSGSGLDPHISPEAAVYQIQRIQRVRAMNSVQDSQIKSLIDAMTEPRSFGIIGEKRVNVLSLNLELDKLTKE